MSTIATKNLTLPYLDATATYMETIQAVDEYIAKAPKEPQGVLEKET